ncbi:MAG: isoprenylcysteine carboxyl methyltransferase family protein [Myxococcota bacterium]
MVIPYLALLALVGIERLVELRISRANARAALENGGIERGQRHFRVMKLLHTAFLIGCAVEVVLLDRPFIPALGVAMLVLALAAQGLRYWAIGTLGRQWTVRVIVVPGRRVVTGGPYRYLRHPNYLAVVVEGLAIPLIHSAWLTALTFTVLNGLLLWVRIRCEESALAQHCDYGQHLGARPRWLPWAPMPKE